MISLSRPSLAHRLSWTHWQRTDPRKLFRMQEENCGCIIRSVITTVILQCYLASKTGFERGAHTTRSSVTLGLCFLVVVASVGVVFAFAGFTIVASSVSTWLSFCPSGAGFSPLRAPLFPRARHPLAFVNIHERHFWVWPWRFFLFLLPHLCILHHVAPLRCVP